MIKVNIDIPKNIDNCLIKTRGDVANILTYILRQKGISIDFKKPAQWGFGVVASKTKFGTSFKKLEKIIIGTSSDNIAKRLRQIK